MLSRSPGCSGAPGAATRKRMPGVGLGDLDRQLAARGAAAQRRHAQVQDRARDQLAIAVERRARARGAGAVDASARARRSRQPAQRLDRLGGGFAQQKAVLPRHELAGLEAVVVQHRANAGLELLEDAARVLDAVVEVGAPGIARRRARTWPGSRRWRPGRRPAPSGRAGSATATAAGRRSRSAASAARARSDGRARACAAAPTARARRSSTSVAGRTRRRRPRRGPAPGPAADR